MYKFSNINMRALTVIENLLVEFINLLMISSLMKVRYLNGVKSFKYSCYAMLRGKLVCIMAPPKHPIIAIWNNRIQNGRRIAKKVASNENQIQYYRK